jgi:hypothetical protein
MQVCHGKLAPLRRIKPDDHIVYYSPTEKMGEKIKLQAFTAIGIVKAGQPYDVDMGNGFIPYRRDVDWFDAEEVPIFPLLSQLDFSAGQKNWGYQMRFGQFKISESDFSVIAQAMGASFN